MKNQDIDDKFVSAESLDTNKKGLSYLLENYDGSFLLFYALVNFSNGLSAMFFFAFYDLLKNYYMVQPN